MHGRMKSLPSLAASSCRNAVRAPLARVRPSALSHTAMAAALPPSAPAGLEQIGCNKQCGGFNVRYKHDSTLLGKGGARDVAYRTGCKMTFTVYLPPAAASGPVPVLFFLSGLTCTDENFIQKSGAQRAAAAAGIALVAPDTSPRGLAVEGEADSWDCAGFYLSATQPKWSAWQMEGYVTQELPGLLKLGLGGQYLDMSRVSLSGHSMGGHGALTLGLRAAPGTYRSLSAFAPICHPSVVPWGTKAFSGYLGDDKASWAQYDSVELLKARAASGKPSSQLPPLLVDTGSADTFLATQLRPEDLQAAAAEAGWANVTMRMQEGYDHSYFFISTFIDEHIQFHAKHLKA